jgi:hypothetical protein
VIQMPQGLVNVWPEASYVAKLGVRVYILLEVAEKEGRTNVFDNMYP